MGKATNDRVVENDNIQEEYDFTQIQPTIKAVNNEDVSDSELPTDSRKDKKNRLKKKKRDDSNSDRESDATDSKEKPKKRKKIKVKKSLKKSKQVSSAALNEEETSNSFKRNTNGVWVGNFNFWSSQSKILAFFNEHCGPVARLHLPMATQHKNKG